MPADRLAIVLIIRRELDRGPVTHLRPLASKSSHNRHVRAMSAWPPQPDMCGAPADVCIGPIADIAPPDGYPEDLLQPYQSRTALPPSYPPSLTPAQLHSASLPCTVCGWRLE